eukprot:CAMPEP_0183303270 /NCGR_PEP_ID=MMETSP0160_2-20130417/8778_1 /TAXON_ID=2839 ORGANISM="Odontella Sinensis, Strain Grunow 1884" /NCGR_SAMPLE_ID=MMETSP0160_2 /ASSEMBLY_ACC=CAM_ASM_000250 /LENGTH=102 /DNA_ID=CAMNT_0025466157 /DNA_START=124 /DNA_END=428 /DNA_ORIENTATION=-
MGKKKPFIDRKNSSTYHVVRRSQRDVGGYGDGNDDDDGDGPTVPSDFVLMPGPNNSRAMDERILGGGGDGGVSEVPPSIPEDPYADFEEEDEEDERILGGGG